MGLGGVGNSDGRCSHQARQLQAQGGAGVPCASDCPSLPGCPLGTGSLCAPMWIQEGAGGASERESVSGTYVFPSLYIRPVHLAVCRAPQGPLYRRPTQPDLGFQLAALSCVKPLSTHGSGQAGAGGGGGGGWKSLHSHSRYPWLFGVTVRVESCAESASPDPCSW